MPRYTRVEALNFSSFLNDTNDLSTIRGAGLAYLEMPDLVLGNAESVNAASHGTAKDGPDQSVIRERIRQLQGPLSQATISIQEVVSNEPFNTVNARLVARTRFDQLQGQSLRYPSIPEPSSAVCQLDHVRPVFPQADEEDQEMSQSTHLRRRYGRTMRSGFYRKELRRAFGPQTPLDAAVANATFTQEFSEITGNSRDFAPLNDRMAVIFLDGDKLGSRFAGLTDWPKYKQHSATLRNTYQANFLNALILAASRESAWKNGNQLRMEALLWGGEELCFVVPAWRALAFLDVFNRVTANWALDGEPINHSIGVVICHHKAPIQPIYKLVDQMATFVKTNHAPGNRVAFQVLKSLDTPSVTFDAEYVSSRFRFLSSPAQFALDIPTLTRLRSAFAQTHQLIPMRQLVLYVQSQFRGQAGDASLITRDLSPEQQALFTGFTPADWYHFYALWDLFSTHRS